MANNPVGWFEIPVSDFERAKAFYSNVFHVKLEDMDMDDHITMAVFPADMEKHGSSGSLVKGEGYTPSRVGIIVYFHSQDCETELSRVEEYGGRILVPKMSIGKHGHIAHFLDSEGNRVALHAPARE